MSALTRKPLQRILPEVPDMRVGGTHIFDLDAGEKLHENVQWAIENLSKLNHGQSSENLHQRMKLYREASNELINAYAAVQQLLTSYRESYEELTGQASGRNRKRWTAEEDEVLIEIASQGERTLFQLALDMARTPGAVQSRLSYLVGIRRISQQVAGRFVGYVDGEPVDAEIEGVLTSV